MVSLAKFNYTMWKLGVFAAGISKGSNREKMAYVSRGRSKPGLKPKARRTLSPA